MSSVPSSVVTDDATRDLMIAEMAESEAALVDRLVDLTLDRDAYRELAQLAIHQLHELRAERRRLGQQHRRVVDDYRRLREQLVREAIAV